MRSSTRGTDKKNWKVVSGVMYLPISAPLKRLKDNAPTVLGVLLLFALSFSLAWQSAQLLRLIRSPAAPEPGVTASDTVQPAQASIARLFGTAPSQESGPPAATNLQLTLLGSFVHSDPGRSSVLIEQQGQPARRHRLGDELSNGVRLEAIHTDHVELLRNGRRETLAFLRPNSNQYSTYVAPVEPSDNNLDQLNQLQQDDMQQLRERMQLLREQMEAAGTLEQTSPTDQPMESD